METRSALAELRSGAIGKNVVALGFTSLFTDISSEMVAASLPAYVVGYLQLGALQFGALDGLQRGAALLVGALVAFFADRLRKRKGTAFAGYAVSAVCKLGLVLAGRAAPALAAIVLVDRTGKGLRTPVRDALIAGSSEPRVLATAFGVHRALDAVGALLGPLVAFAVLAVAPEAFDAVFVVSLCFAVIGLAVLALFVDEGRTHADPRPPPSTRDAVALLADVRFRPIVIVATAFALCTVSEGFIYLALQRRDGFSGERIPLLFVGTALVQLVLTLPAARLADRIGRAKVFLGGQALLLAAYAALLAPLPSAVQPIVCVACLGGFLAATDGVLAAMASARLARDLAASGLAIVGAATGAAKLVASLAFGALWASHAPSFAILVFGAAVLVILPLAAFALRDPSPRSGGEHARAP
jgi:MFS family permease